MAGADNCIDRDSNGRFMGWVDRNHCIYSGRTLAGARWFDDLFGDWYDDEARVLVRIISETGFAEGQNASSTIQVRASAELPNAKKRLRLVITDDSDRDERLSGQDALSQLNRTSGKVSAAVRLTPATGVNSSLILMWAYAALIPLIFLRGRACVITGASAVMPFSASAKPFAMAVTPEGAQLPNWMLNECSMKVRWRVSVVAMNTMNWSTPTALTGGMACPCRMYWATPGLWVMGSR